MALGGALSGPLIVYFTMHAILDRQTDIARSKQTTDRKRQQQQPEKKKKTKRLFLFLLQPCPLLQTRNCALLLPLLSSPITAKGEWGDGEYDDDNNVMLAAQIPRAR